MAFLKSIKKNYNIEVYFKNGVVFRLYFKLKMCVLTADNFITNMFVQYLTHYIYMQEFI